MILNGENKFDYHVEDGQLEFFNFFATRDYRGSFRFISNFIARNSSFSMRVRNNLFKIIPKFLSLWQVVTLKAKNVNLPMILHHLTTFVEFMATYVRTAFWLLFDNFWSTLQGYSIQMGAPDWSMCEIFSMENWHSLFKYSRSGIHIVAKW